MDTTNKTNYPIQPFGELPNGQPVSSCLLTNNQGMQLQVINFGATVLSLKVPLKNGSIVDVVLGFDSLESYLKSFDLKSATYYGATVGRFAGRINQGVFVLNGKEISLNKNNDNYSLHGGIHGFSQKIWDIIAVDDNNDPSIKLRLLSMNNDENFPGDLEVELKYTLSEKNELILEYQAKATEDTIINLTHHSYFNLDGHKASIEEQELLVNSEKIVETNEHNVPTGIILNIGNGPFDFRTPKKCPLKMDNTFVLDSENEYAAALISKKNNLRMSVYTNQPGVHIYVGGDCDNQLQGKENAKYHALSGICFETQNFPDAPNHDNFPTAILRKGELYQHKTIYKFQTF